MALIYLDTSVYLSAFLEDASQHQACRELWSKPQVSFVSSRLLRTEALRQCVRFIDEGLDPGVVTAIRAGLDQVSLVRLTDQVCDRAEDFPFQLKTLDALHLATALELMPGLDGLATKDRLMTRSAMVLGLPVEPLVA
jgi:predicted nucleic acid-binding protein